MRLIPGQRFGQFVIAAELGRGGQAVVYRAHQTGLDRDVALKVFDVAADARPADVERFRREAVAAARLEHPRIVAVFDAGEAEGHPYIAMQLIPGSTLASEVARTGPLPPARALKILDDIAQALDFAHARGLVHRDVKSANILIGPQDVAYLGDFGLARMDDMPGLTRRGDWMGTAEYAAPEVIAGDPATAASDLYGFAVCAYEALTGRPPYVHREASAVLLAHVREDVPAASTTYPRLPAGVDAVLAGGLAKDPDDRPRRAQGLVEDLRAALAVAPARATVVGAAASVGAAAPAEARPDGWTTLMGRFSDPPSGEGPAPGVTTRMPLPAVAADGDGDGQDAPEGTRTLVLTRRRLAVGGAVAVAAVALLGAGAFAVGHASAPDSNVARQEGFRAGVADGFAKGRAKGLEQGLGRGTTLGRRAGLAEGKRQGLKQGREEGIATGREEGFRDGRASVFGGLSGGPPSPGSYYVVQPSGDGGIQTWFSDPLVVEDCFQITADGGLRQFGADGLGGC